MHKYNPCNPHEMSYSRQLLAPPPSRVSTHVRPPPQTVVAVKKVRTPTPVQTPVEQKNKIVADFLNRVLFGINKGVRKCGDFKILYCSSWMIIFVKTFFKCV